MFPEEKARLTIDEKLTVSGWVVQDREEYNPRASLGVVVRNYATSSGPADYLMVVDGKPVGIIESKEDREGQNITVAEDQSTRYLKSGIKGLPERMDKRRFTYEATSVLIRFTDHADVLPRAREIFSFQRPETLKLLLDAENNTLRNKLRSLPPLDSRGFRSCQTTALVGLERSFAENRPKALVQMATGAGKTFTAVTEAYRLLRYGGVKRVLFLVDTRNLGFQAEEEFRRYKPNDESRLFSELYNVLRLTSKAIPEDTHVCISTIQRMYSILKNEPLSEVEEDEYEVDERLRKPKEVQYNPRYPPEFFDLIIVDECHRSIYNVWKQVLDYFDAFLVGITATPDNRTLAFFNKNLVSEYSHEEAVRDGVNVDGDVYIIKTDVSEHGGVICKQWVEVRDRQTRSKRWEYVDEEKPYTSKDLDRSVINPSQIRLVIRTFKERLFTEIFPNRREVPKTLIFAKSDSHADDIIQIVREEFGESNDFCKKVTYRADEDPQMILSNLRNDYYPRVAVTVDMISAGTDIKGLECLIFMCDVRSASRFEQMKGRGVRTFSKENLQKITPSALNSKDRYVLIDAVSVCESQKVSGRPLDRKPSVSLKDLMQFVVMGGVEAGSQETDDILTTLAKRLFKLNQVLDDKEATEFKELTGKSMGDVGGELLDCFDKDILSEHAAEKFSLASPDDASDEQRRRVQAEMLEDATAVFYDPKVRSFILDSRRKHDQVIDNSTLDSLISAGYGTERIEAAASEIASFKEYIEKNREEIDALSIIYSQSYRNRKLTFKMIRELSEKIFAAGFSVEKLWSDYSLTDVKRVKGNGIVRKTADIISLVKMGYGLSDLLEPFSSAVNRNFMSWTLMKNAGSIHFTEEQMVWLRMIRDHIAASVEICSEDFDLSPFGEYGGLGRFYELFGDAYLQILDEVNAVLPA